MSKKIDAKVEAVKNVLRNHGYNSDRHGNMIKVLTNGDIRRYKFQDISVRKELKPVKNSLGEKWVHGWIRTRSYYYKDVEIKDGKLSIGKVI